MTTAIYERLPVLVRHAPNRATRDMMAWPIKYLRMFDMTNDSQLFRTGAELQADGWYPVVGGRWCKGDQEAVALYVGRMFRQFDHRAANVTVNEENLHNAALSEGVSLAEKQDPSFTPEPQYWVEWSDVDPKLTWALAFRDIARVTDERTIISAVLPGAAYGNTAALLLGLTAGDAALLLGNLNSFALDYIARQKVQSTHANWYIIEQLPVVPPESYDLAFGQMTAREIVEREVLRLTYTAHDVAPFARDMGHVDKTGKVRSPFEWDEADRRQRRARLDALYFHLYGIDRGDADYILSTFPIVERHDIARFGRYLTRDLILHQMDALAAGDSEAIISLN